MFSTSREESVDLEILMRPQKIGFLPEKVNIFPSVRIFHEFLSDSIPPTAAKT